MSRKLGLAIAVSILLAAGACAKAADETQVLTGDAALSALRAAPETAADAGSVHFEMTISIDTADGAFEIVATGGLKGDQMTMEMDLGSVLEQAAVGSGDTVPDGFDEPVQIVVDGTTSYMHWPMLQAITGDTGWLSMTPDDMGMAGSTLGLGAGANNPANLLETLRGASDDIKEVGTEQVRGVSTTHLRGTLDIDKALAQMPPEQRALVEDQLSELSSTGAGVPVDVWIDGEGLPRRMTMDLGAFAGAMGADGTATMTMEFFDYGEPVSVVIPDASETTPFSEVMGSLGGAG